MLWTEKYLRVEFKDRGSSWDGCDCWGFCCLILREELGKELPLYEDIPAGADAEKAQQFLADKTMECWQPIPLGEEQTFDMLLMRGVIEHEGQKRAVPIHVACVVTPGTLIQIEASSQVTTAKYTHPRIRRRIVQIYRFLG